MGWYLRKSFRLGPLLRLNLSKSGLGYSFGIKGARIGSGPRGNYVHVGRYGLYYRQYLSNSPSAVPGSPKLAEEKQHEIPTAEASALVDRSDKGVLSEIQEKQQIKRLAPAASAAFGVLFVILVLEGATGWLLALIFLIGVGVGIIASRYDRERKTVVLHFHLDDTAKTRYEALLEAVKTLSSCSRVWRVSNESETTRPKYNAGARLIISRKQATITASAPPFFQTDLPVWCLALRSQDLYFFPDRLLVYQGRSVGAVSYADLQVQVSPTRFFEDDLLPSDTVVLGHTWQYANRDGGPDRRFSNNRQIPIVQYAETEISSSTGMHILLQASNVQKATIFAKGVNSYAQEANLKTPAFKIFQADLETSSSVPGNEETMFCTNCGAKNAAEARFCNQCGKPITTLSSTAEPPASASPPVAPAGLQETPQTPVPQVPSDADRATSMVTVTIQNKRYQELEYEKYLWWDATYNPVALPKPTRAIKGLLEFADLFGELHFSLKVVLNDPMQPGKTLTTAGVGFSINEFMDDHKWMLATDVSDMTVKFRIESISTRTELETPYDRERLVIPSELPGAPYPVFGVRWTPPESRNRTFAGFAKGDA